MLVVHNSNSVFDNALFKEIKNYPAPCLNKPKGGLWTSPLDSRYSWKNWCEKNEPSFLKSNLYLYNFQGKILEINDSKDLYNLPVVIYNLLELSGDKLENPEEYDSSIFISKIIYYQDLDENTLPYTSCLTFDYEAISKEYDALYLTVNAMSKLKYNLFLNFYAWDCETVLILNPQNLKFIKQI